MQGADGVPRLAAQRIKDADDGGELARDAEIEMGILCGQGLELFILALRHKLHCLGPLERKGRQRLHHSGAAVLIGGNGVLRPVEDLDVHHTGHGAQIVFQHIRLAQRHRAARQMDADAPSGFM